MSSAPQDIHFNSVLSRRSAERRTILFVIPGVIVLFAIVAFGAVAISRQSGLETQVRVAKEQVQEANKVVEDRDRQLREAHGETAVLASAGQGAAVLSATSKESPASGVVLDHPAQHALAVYGFNLVPPPEGQEYRLIVTDGMGQESLLGTLRPDERGGSFLMARDVPEGISKVEVALVPVSATKQGGDKNPASADASQGAADKKEPMPKMGAVERKPIMVGALPKPGEAGVVLANANADQEKGSSKASGARAGRRGGR